MVMTAWALTVHAGAVPEYPGQSVLMRGDNQSACHWVARARGAREPRSGALMRMLGCLEMRNGWQFRAKHIKGLANTLADGISRWNRDDIANNLHSYRPDICWQEQHLGPEAVDVTSAILQSFCRMTARDELFRAGVSQEKVTWALIEFAAWCFESGNMPGTISGKLAAVQYFHRMHAGVELETSSPLLKCALRGIARSHVDAGTRHRVRLPITLDMMLEGEPITSSGESSRHVLWMCLTAMFFFLLRSDEMFASEPRRSSVELRRLAGGGCSRGPLPGT